MTDPKALFRRARQLSAVLAVVLLTSLLGTAGAGADPIAQKRAEAARLASQLEAQNNRLSVLAEKVDAARLKADQIGGSLAKAEAGLAAATKASDAARSRLKSMAVDAYVRGGTAAPEASPMATDENPAIRQGYLEQLTSGQNEALDAMRAARLSLGEQRATLQSAKNQANQILAGVASAERQAAQAEAEVRASLAKAKGELGTLVAAEQARRDAADRARTSSAMRASRSRSFGPPPPVGKGASFAVNAAMAQLGKPYQWGGSGPDTFDCSGLTMYAWRYGGVGLPHSAAAQYSSTAHISLADIQPGDLLFYGSPISHVGIYVGGGQMINAPHTGDVVRYASINHGGMPVGIGRPG